jgi:hypothetical protein
MGHDGPRGIVHIPFCPVWWVHGGDSYESLSLRAKDTPCEREGGWRGHTENSCPLVHFVAHISLGCGTRFRLLSDWF